MMPGACHDPIMDVSIVVIFGIAALVCAAYVWHKIFN